MTIRRCDPERDVYVESDLSRDRDPTHPWRIKAGSTILARASSEEEAVKLVEQIRDVLKKAMGRA